MPKKHDYGRESAALLATSLVFLLGFVAVLFVIATSFSDPLWPALGTGAALFFVFICFVGFARAKENSAGGGTLSTWFKGVKPEAMPDYSPRRVRTSGGSRGSNQPPSADDVRDIKESSPNTWVPSSVRKEKR